MHILSEALTHPFIMNLGSWLLHFTWQSILLGFLLAVFLRLSRHVSSEARYVACWLAIGFMLVLPTITTLDAFQLTHTDSFMTTSVELAVPVAENSLSSETQKSTLYETETGLSFNGVLISMTRLRGYLALIWMLGIIVFAFRLQLGLSGTRRLKQQASDCGSNQLHSILSALCKKLNINRSVVLKRSKHIDQPVLIGWLKPVILLPAGILAGLPPLQVEAILAHELAHVRRHDYLFSVLQSVLETLFFFHPAIWWISHRIRIEREYCCDDLAVKTTGEKKTYLNTLAQLEVYRTASLVPALSMNDGSLLDRVQRIVTRSLTPHPKNTLKSKILTMTFALFVFASILTTIGINAPVSTAQTIPDVESNLQQDISIDAAPAVVISPQVNIELNIENNVYVLPTDTVSDKPAIHPLKRKMRVSSGFGMRRHPVTKEKKLHRGIDFVVSTGTTVYATAGGTIKTVTQDEGYGKYIVISHSEGFETLYSNLSEQHVEEGALVKQGDKIAESGNTGISTAPHLHYEVRLNETAVDPVDYLPKELLGGLELDKTPHAHPLRDNKVAVYSGFGKRYHPVLEINRLHTGIDFLVPKNTPVYATASGKVQASKKHNGLGKYVKLTHPAGFETTYAHLSSIDVAPGEFVQKGDLIGKTGNTGLSAGPHLHYEIRLNGEAIDPAAVLAIESNEKNPSMD